MRIPSCETPGKCQIMAGPESATAAYYPPVYTAEGVNANPDRNLVTRSLHCLACGKTWVQKTRGGQSVTS